MVSLGLRVASDILERMKLSLESVTFGGLRDIYKALGYPHKITNRMYRDRYDRGGIAGRIIDAYPTATWRGIGEVYDDPDPKTETEFEKTWKELQKRLKIWSTFRRADIISGLGRYSVVFIGAIGNPETELSKNLNPKSLLYLSRYNEDEAQITEYELDPTNERFGKPKFYTIARKNSDSKVRQPAMRVHWTRVIHVSDGLLEDDVFSRPRLERAWNTLDDLMKVAGGGSEAFWKTAYPGVQFNVDKDMKFKEDELTKLKEQVDEFMNDMTRAVKTRGVNMETLQANIVDFSKNGLFLISLLSGITGIPQRLLLGSERGELASTQDRDNWAERVRDRRDDFAGPFVVEPFVDRLIEYGILPKPKNGEYQIGWGDVYDISQTERVETAGKYAEINQKMGETVVTPDEIRDQALGLEPLDPSQLDDEEDDEETTEEDPSDTEDSEDGDLQKRAAAWNQIQSNGPHKLIAASGKLT